MDSIVKRALEESVSPAQLQKYYISKNIEKLKLECAKDYLDENGLDYKVSYIGNYNNSSFNDIYLSGGYNTYKEKTPEYKELLMIVANYKPQSEASKSKIFKEIEKVIDTKIEKINETLRKQKEKEEVAEKKRQQLIKEKNELITEMKTSKLMFKEHRDAFIEKLDSYETVAKAKKAMNYKEKVKEKK